MKFCIHVGCGYGITEVCPISTNSLIYNINTQEITINDVSGDMIEFHTVLHFTFSLNMTFCNILHIDGKYSMLFS